MRTVVRITTKGKVRPVRRRALDRLPAVDDRASLVVLIQAVIPLGLQAVEDVLQQEVTALAGAGIAGPVASRGRCAGAGSAARSICSIRRCQ